jgi:hypothetical protein
LASSSPLHDRSATHDNAGTDALLDALTEFARTLVDRYAIADVLTQLTDRVVGALDLDGAGVFVDGT